MLQWEVSDLHLDVFTLQRLVQLLEVSSPQRLGLHWDMSKLQRPVMLLEVSTPQGPEVHLELSTIQRPVLHLDVSTPRGLSCTWTWLDNRRLCCSWMCLHYEL